MWGIEEELLHELARQEMLRPDEPLQCFPRRVLADWLDENGQVERATFIRLQVAAEELGLPSFLPGHADDPPLKLPGPEDLPAELAAQALQYHAQARALWQENQATLLAPYPEELRESLVFRGGLPWLCRLPWAQWCVCCDSVRHHPGLASLRAWRFESPREGISSLPSACWLPGVPFALSLTGPGAAGGVLASPGLAPWLHSVRYLGLTEGALYPSREHLAESGLLPGLRGLNLAANHLESASLLALGRSGALTGLSELSLARNHMAFEDAMFLFDSSWNLSGLKRLDLHGTDLSPGALWTLAELSWTRGLEALDLSHTEVMSDWVGGLAVLPGVSMRELRLAGCSLDQNAWKPLAEAQCFPRLQRLDLSETQITGEGWLGLTRTMGNSLHELRAVGCGLESPAVEQLAQSAARSTLRTLDLGRNSLGDPGFQVLIQHTWPSLIRLGLGLNSISSVVPEIDRKQLPWLHDLELARP